MNKLHHRLPISSRLSASVIVALFLYFVAAFPALCDDWPQFRGARGDGISTEPKAPVAWDRQRNIQWRVALDGRNNSSPVVSRGLVFVAVASEDGRRRSLHCYDRETGAQRWVRTAEFAGEEPTHNTSLYGGSTPAADGTRVVVWHSSAGMHCYDYAGTPLWSADLGQFDHIWGYGASPIFYGNLVLNNCGPGERSFLVALDKETGEEAWRYDQGGRSGTERPWIGSWSTPVVARIDGRDQVLVSYPEYVKAFDPLSGTVLWRCGGLTELVYTSVVTHGDYAVAMGGFTGPAIGFKLGGQEHAATQAPLWRVEKNPQRIGTGVILDGIMYMGNEPGTIECFDIATNSRRWEEKIPEPGKLWSSIVYAGGNLYTTTQRGTTIVFKPNPEKFEVVSVNPVGETTNATIAVSDAQIFLRTHEALYCIAEE